MALLDQAQDESSKVYKKKPWNQQCLQSISCGRAFSPMSAIEHILTQLLLETLFISLLVSQAYSALVSSINSKSYEFS